MDLFNLEYFVNTIVKDLKIAKMYSHRDNDEAWGRVDHALDTALEIARQLEAGWGDGGDRPS